MKKGLTLTFFASVIFLIFFAAIFFNGKTLSTTAITPQTFAKGVFNYQGHIMKTLPLKDPGAFSWHHYPLMQLNNYAYKNGELPLWNPYLGSGQPLVADQQSGGFFPLYAPLFINPSLVMWDLLFIFRLMVAFVFTYLFARRLGFGQKTSFLSGVVFTFTGYFWFFITMNHLSIEVLIPAAFYFSERLFQDTKLKNAAGLAVVFGLALLGGMPESSFLLIVISSLYLFIRSAADFRKNGKRLLVKRSIHLLLALGIGFALSGIIILPFLEYLQNSFHLHGGGAGAYKIPYRGLADLVIPNFSWPGKNWANINRHYAFNYVGVLPLVLAFIASKKSITNRIFFGIAIVYILKAVGFPVIDKIRYLPYFESIYYPKYFAPYFAFSIAILSGSALNSLKEIKYKKLMLSAGLWFGSVIIILFYYWERILAQGFRAEIALRLAVPLFIVLLFLVLFWLYKRKLISVTLMITITIILITIELFTYLPNDRSNRHNPKKEASYINFLNKQKKPFRIMAFDRLLFPNTAAIFKLEDTRLLNALVIDRYREYMGVFMDQIRGGHITGHENIDLNSTLLDLINTKYLVGSDSLRSQITSHFVRATKPRPNYVMSGKEYIVVLDNKKKYVYKLAIPQTSEGISFEALASPKSEMKISVNDKSITKEIGSVWKPVEINAESRGPNPYNFTFEADSEIKIKNFMYKSRAGNRLNRFKLIYDKDVLIYENTQVLPRAFVAYDFKEYKSSNSVLDALSSNRFDLSKTVLLEEKLVKKFEKKDVDHTMAKVKQTGLNTLTVKVNNPRDGLLFLADNFYPGWKAIVNGKERKIYRANYTYRAVFVPKGKNKIEFVYQPTSLRRGFMITVFGIIILISILIIGFFRGRKKALNI